jgi:endonuclease/exonuclease/phosphatase family metal-dependent hydrolase
MPWYNDLRPSKDPKKQNHSITFPDFDDDQKVRTINNLLHLRTHLYGIRNKKRTNGNILLASWNIKQFGSLKSRIPDSYFYITEIIASFDLVALQEIQKGLEDLKIVMKLLGSHWKYIINDITEGNEGNDERFAYLYDSRRVEFTGLAGEIVLWKELMDDEQSEVTQLKRTPFITGFRAGWKSFAIVNLHLQPGNDSESKAIRKKEMELLTKAISSKLKSENLWSDNLILLGDFNMYKDNTDIVKLLNDKGFKESDLTKNLNTNTAQRSEEPFDRIFFKESLYFKTPSIQQGNIGGVIDILELLYKVEDYHWYKEEMKKAKEDPSTLSDEEKYRKYFRDFWRKNQLSDHKPIWIEIEIDSSDEFLRSKLSGYGT